MGTCQGIGLNLFKISLWSLQFRQSFWTRILSSLGRPIPIGPGFYLNSNQFSKWASQAYFLDYDQRFIGPIESSYTLGILKTFQVYKSVPANACFLEVHHLDNRYLDKRLRFD